MAYDINWEVPRIIIQDELGALMRQIIENHVAAGQWATGRTMKSMRVEAQENYGRLVGKKFFGVLETGRKAGKVPSDFSAIILAWMRAKGLKADPIPYKTNKPHKYTPQERGDRQLAFFIARKIGREGSLLHRQGGRHDIYSEAVAATKERIRERMVEFTTTEFKNIKLFAKVGGNQ